ncbi:DUF4198 domain-containing protein [uncultured Desulfosarcina sp.]|uniref:DUF4198 domain-containing protein n=1 Tax=uncultured Desulfosarcina sp. TaxID=218289 RepID=UPI0029C975FF|nr:DUF4198 domain-containing protein [uncultured Desulfosarcina sp.]
MKCVKSALTVALVLGCCLVVSSSVSAHSLWLNVTDYSPEIFTHPKYAPTPRAKTVVYFGWGHHYPVADFLGDKYLGECFVVQPDGSKDKLTPGNSGFRATELTMKSEGARIVAAALNPGFYGEVEGKKDFFKLHYEQYAKAVISVGKVPDDAFSKPVGHKFEIVPLTNPDDLQLGDWFKFKVLLDGKPAERADITACSLFSFTNESFVGHTDNKGEAKIRVLQHYGPWIVMAQMKQSPAGELKKKCQELSYTATITFAVP